MSTTTATGERLYSYERHFDPNNPNKERLLAPFIITGGNQQSTYALGSVESSGKTNTNTGQGGSQHSAQPPKTDELRLSNTLVPLEGEETEERFVFLPSLGLGDDSKTETEPEEGAGVTKEVSKVEKQNQDVKRQEDEHQPKAEETKEVASGLVFIDSTGDGKFDNSDQLLEGDEITQTLDTNGDDIVSYFEFRLQGGSPTNFQEVAAAHVGTNEQRTTFQPQPQAA